MSSCLSRRMIFTWKDLMTVQQPILRHSFTLLILAFSSSPTTLTPNFELRSLQGRLLPTDWHGGRPATGPVRAYCTTLDDQGGCRWYLPLPSSPTAPLSILVQGIGFLFKEWSDLQCMSKTEAGSCFYHPCPPSTPATGVNWACKASRNIGATFIARMQPTNGGRVLISQDGHHLTLCVSQMRLLPQTHDIQQVPADSLSSYSSQF